MAHSPKACSLIRRLPHYRAEAFEAGLRAAGYAVQASRHQSVRTDDVLLIWNRYGSYEVDAELYQRAGARILVAENGFTGRRDSQGRQYYAISLMEHHHGGAPADEARWPGWTLAPWREAGAKRRGNILVCDQRSIGSKLMASPRGWGERTVKRLQQMTKRYVKLRPHPGKAGVHGTPPVPLEHDLAGTHAVVVWSSNAGIAALRAGIPVFYDAPRWIAEASAHRLAEADIENPLLPDRRPGLLQACSNEWSVDEIASGLPFRLLLSGSLKHAA